MKLLVANDAGGANAVRSIITEGERIDGYLTGPAKTILGSDLNISIVSNVNLKLYEEVLFGTSWHDKIWLHILRDCINKKIKHRVVLDHWVNYQERFFLDKLLIIPKHIVVLDVDAQALAISIFQNSKIELVANQYLLQMKSNVKRLRKKNCSENLLFISEYTDIYLHSEKMWYEQKLFEKTCKYYLASGFKVVLRCHPGEAPDKYKQFEDKYDFVYSDEPLEFDLAAAGLVVGHDSYALYLATICGIPCKRVQIKDFKFELSVPGNLITIEL